MHIIYFFHSLFALIFKIFHGWTIGILDILSISFIFVDCALYAWGSAGLIENDVFLVLILTARTAPIRLETSVSQHHGRPIGGPPSPETPQNITTLFY